MTEDTQLPPIHPDAKNAPIGDRLDQLLPPEASEWVWANNLNEKLRTRNPIRHLITEILAGQRQTLPLDFLRLTLTDSSPSKWRERALAAWALGAVPIEREQIESVTLLLSDVVSGRISHDRFGKGCARSYFTAYAICCACTLSIVGIYFHHGERGFPFGEILYSLFFSAFVSIPVGLAVSPVVIPVSMAKDRKRLNFIRASAARALGRVGTPHAIGALVE